jgi:hypothetical protein
VDGRSGAARTVAIVGVGAAALAANVYCLAFILGRYF